LQVSVVTPPTMHVFEHECVAALQAWLTGQSALVLQPHLPPMHWLLPLHGPHAAPFVPQDWLDVFVLHAPVASQQPLGHDVGVHLGTHAPAEHLCVAEHVAHEPPPVPQLAAPEVMHWPPAEQQPDAHVAGVHGTLASPPASPASVSAPPSVFAPSPALLSATAPSDGASGAPSAVPPLEEPPSRAVESEPASART
jgi:hypothetical protein